MIIDRLSKKYPKRIAITVNSKCNLKCIMCDIGQSNKEGKFYKSMNRKSILSKEILFKISNEIKGKNTSIHINGTEPLLYNDLSDILFNFSKNKIPVALTTNGFLLADKVDVILDSGVENVAVSIDGPKKLHDKIRGVSSSHDRAITGISKLLDFRSNNLTVRIAITISNLNYKELYKTVDQLLTIGVDNIIVSHLNFVNHEMAELHNRNFSQYFGRVDKSSVFAVDPNKLDINLLNKEIVKIRSDFDNVNFLPNLEIKEEIKDYYLDPMKKVHSDFCRAPWKNMQILADGNVITASRCFNRSIGNIYESSIKEIWNGELYNSFRKNLRKVGISPACNRCCALFSKKTL